jgi:predicted peroxiredoxin
MMKKWSLLFGLCVVMCFSPVWAAEDADVEEKLFVNLTSDEVNRAGMALTFSTRVLQEKKIPVTIFLNVDGVRIADKTLPSPQHPMGKSLQQMLANFIKAGGQVIACPMCMKYVGGLSKENLLEGVEVGGPDVTWPALFSDNTTVMSY